MIRRNRLLLWFLLLLAVLIGAPIVLTWRAIRQEQLDRALLSAIAILSYMETLSEEEKAAVRKHLQAIQQERGPVGL